jgi:hypothetical protein
LPDLGHFRADRRRHHRGRLDRHRSSPPDRRPHVAARPRLSRQHDPLRYLHDRRALPQLYPQRCRNDSPKTCVETEVADWGPAEAARRSGARLQSLGAEWGSLWRRLGIGPWPAPSTSRRACSTSGRSSGRCGNGVYGPSFGGGSSGLPALRRGRSRMTGIATAPRCQRPGFTCDANALVGPPSPAPRARLPRHPQHFVDVHPG